jgi:hypothetical protein
MQHKEATARIKINKLFEEAGWQGAGTEVCPLTELPFYHSLKW